MFVPSSAHADLTETRVDSNTLLPEEGVYVYT